VYALDLSCPGFKATDMAAEILGWFPLCFFLIIGLFVAYLARLNSLLKHVPEKVQVLCQLRWTAEELKKTYTELENRSLDYKAHVPPRLERRYVVTGGNGKLMAIQCS